MFIHSFMFPIGWCVFGLRILFWHIQIFVLLTCHIFTCMYMIDILYMCIIHVFLIILHAVEYSHDMYPHVPCITCWSPHVPMSILFRSMSFRIVGENLAAEGRESSAGAGAVSMAAAQGRGYSNWM
jgi:hypothetical protein